MPIATEAPQPRTIRLHLINGTGAGIVQANAQRGALVFRAPRSRSRDLCRREEANRKGIYLLTGRSLTNPSKQKIYIGESDCLRARIPIQERNHDFFDHIVFAVGKDDTLSKDHFRYIESKIIRWAREAEIVEVANETDPEFARLCESDRVEADDFLAEVMLMFSIFGLDIFRAVDGAAGSQEIPTFETDVSGTHARARETDDGFIVLASSTVRIEETESLPAAIRAERERLIRDGKLVPHMPGYYRFVSDTCFNSPSEAAAVIAGRSASGPLEWKIPGENQTYRDWRQSQLGT